MSVLVKGIDMPKSCRECHFLSYAYNVPLCSVTRQIPTYPLQETLEQALSKRMNNCPLVEGTEEVRNGRWEGGEDAGKYCSVCHQRTLIAACMNATFDGIEYRQVMTPFCMWCGASMDKVEDE